MASTEVVALPHPQVPVLVPPTSKDVHHQWVTGSYINKSLDKSRDFDGTNQLRVGAANYKSSGSQSRRGFGPPTDFVRLVPFSQFGESLKKCYPSVPIMRVPMSGIQFRRSLGPSIFNL